MFVPKYGRENTTMDSWLSNTLVVVLLTLLFLVLISALTIKYSDSLLKKNAKIRVLEKDNKHKQELLDAYGIKEINIERESDD